MKFLEWFVKDDDAEEDGQSWAATPAMSKVLSSPEFRKATPYNEAFYQTMLMVKDFWAAPEYAKLLEQLEQAAVSLHRRRQGHGQGSARRPRRRLGQRRSTSTSDTVKNKRASASGGSGRLAFPAAPPNSASEVRKSVQSSSMSRSRSRARAALAISAIRNLFILPTIAFLIIFNIFPLIYSLGYSFTDYSASRNAPAYSSVCRTIGTCWTTTLHLEQFSDHGASTCSCRSAVR